MRLACLDGGPAGLYVAISSKLRQPKAQASLSTPSVRVFIHTPMLETSIAKNMDK
ncbi:hypothetical protein [uncultured Sulfitobacter sp.]|uniref:hypothetical protein n=1 Tax=uncultured Sulfitobacter sp. TaxID=191468 RepID=UPI0026042BBE|nr:hypothetical protein [uncultured Sulfitobacter sp.]